MTQASRSPARSPGRRSPRAQPARPPTPVQLVADIARLREDGYLKLAVPVRLGGAGLNLRQVARAQRRARGTGAGRRVRRERPPCLDRGRSRHAGQRRAGRSGGLAGCSARRPREGSSPAGPGRPTGTACDLRRSSKPWRAIRRAGTGPLRWSPATAGPGRPAGIRLHPTPGQPRAGARHAAWAAGGRAGGRDVQLGTAAGGHDLVCHRPAGVRAGRAGGAATAGRWRRARAPLGRAGAPAGPVARDRGGAAAGRHPRPAGPGDRVLAAADRRGRGHHQPRSRRSVADQAVHRPVRRGRRGPAGHRAGEADHGTGTEAGLPDGRGARGGAGQRAVQPPSRTQD